MSAILVPSLSCSRLLVHVVALCFSSAFNAISSIEMLRDEIRGLDRIISRCVVVSAHDVSNFVPFTHMTHNSIDSNFMQPISKCFCSSLLTLYTNFSFPSVDGPVVMYLSWYSAFFTDGASVARPFHMVTPNPFSSIVRVVGDSSISLRCSLLNNNIYGSSLSPDPLRQRKSLTGG